MIGPNTVVSRSEEPVSAEVDGTVVMMSIDQGMYFGLEGVGSRIWALIEQPRSVRDLCGALTQEFDIDAESCHHEVVEFLEELLDAQLIRTHDNADATIPPPDWS
jgi:hypothetical protein